jgi:hypothetical protein
MASIDYLLGLVADAESMSSEVETNKALVGESGQLCSAFLVTPATVSRWPRDAVRRR